MFCGLRYEIEWFLGNGAVISLATFGTERVRCGMRRARTWELRALIMRILSNQLAFPQA